MSTVTTYITDSINLNIFKNNIPRTETYLNLRYFK